jgi:hypothetical protein
MNNEESFDNLTYSDQVHLAERELASFIAAVKELFGPEQALLSADDWLDESELMDCAPRSTSREWRAVTVAASARLANRVTGARDRRTSTSSTDQKVSPILSSNCFASALLV